MSDDELHTASPSTFFSTCFQEIGAECWIPRTPPKPIILRAALWVMGYAAASRYASVRRGISSPQKQKVELARCSAHRECYLLVIVVVILCPVWRCINRQHANTFCWNICDRHIFRLPSKIEKRNLLPLSLSFCLSLPLTHSFLLSVVLCVCVCVTDRARLT